MKYFIVGLGVLVGTYLFGVLAYAQTPPLNTHQGGTGVNDIAAGAIPFGSVYNLRIATSTAFLFNTSLSRLTVTNASSTYASAITSSSTNLFAGNITNQSAKTALIIADSSGLESAYTGSNPCTNQVPISINKSGILACGNVTNAMLSNSSLTVNTNYSMTGGGSVALGSSLTLAVATSSLFAAGTAGNVLTYTSAGTWIASATTTFSGALVYANGAVTLNTSGTWSGNAGTATALATGRTLSISGDLAYTSPSFDGSGNVTAAGTLATVNSNVGSFTNASITVNGKGLITAASNGTAAAPSISTTTGLSIGQGAYFTSVTPTIIGGFATGTVSAGSSAITVTANRASIGGALAIDCATASGSQNGCLSSTDWSTFNSKISANQTITLTGVVTGSGSTAITTAFGSQTAGVLGSPVTGNTSPQATSTLYGAVQNGKVLAGLGGLLAYVATTTAGTGLTYDGTSFNVTLGTSIDLTSEVTGDLPFSNIAQLSANTVWANITGATADGAALSTSSLFAGTNGQTLARVNGTWLGVATTTAGTGLSYNGTSFNVTGLTTTQFASAAISQWTNDSGYRTGSGSSGNCVQWGAANALADAGSPCGSGGGNSFAYPFLLTSNAGTTTAATTTPMWFHEGIFASSTSQFDNASTTMLTVTSNLWVGNGGTGDSAMQMGTTSTNQWWTLGYRGSDQSFDISSSTALGTNNAFKIDTALNPYFPHLSLGLTATGQSGIQYNTATSAPTFNGGLTTSGTAGAWVGGSSYAVSLANINANSVLGNVTGASGAPTSLATSSLFTGPAGSVGFFSSLGNLVGTSTAIFIDTKGYVGIASSSNLQNRLTVGDGIASSSILVAEYDYGLGGRMATSTAAVIDARNSNNMVWPIGTSATTLTLCNLTPGQHLLIRVINPNNTAGALTWAACAGSKLYWPGGTIPTQTTTANAWDYWSFIASASYSPATTTTSVIITGAQTANFK